MYLSHPPCTSKLWQVEFISKNYILLCFFAAVIDNLMLSEMTPTLSFMITLFTSIRFSSINWLYLLTKCNAFFFTTYGASLKPNNQSKLILYRWSLDIYTAYHNNVQPYSVRGEGGGGSPPLTFWPQYMCFKCIKNL